MQLQDNVVNLEKRTQITAVSQIINFKGITDLVKENIKP